MRATRENGERILRVLGDFGFGDLGLELGDFTTPGRVIQLGRPPNRIDLLTSISGVEFDEAWSTRAAGELGDHAVFFLGRDALLRNKAASDRDKDRLDLKKLLAIRARRGG